MKEISKWLAFDKTEFYTPKECEAYERENAHMRLVGLTVEQIVAAVSLEDSDLALAIEIVGNKVSAARRATGNFRRPPKRSAAVTPEGKPTEAAIIAAGGTPGEPPPEPYYQPPVSDGAPLDDGEEF